MDPSPPDQPRDTGNAVSASAFEKARLRRHYRRLRRDHVHALPESVRALILNRPPAPVAARISDGATVGLYYPLEDEAPALGWARWLAEHGRAVALPAFADPAGAMCFRLWLNPFDESLLEPSPWGTMQPGSDAPQVVPDLIVTPLLAFTASGFRLGQGGGHYDRWLEAHPRVSAIGLAWDCQLAEALPCEPHDRPLHLVVTPTRIYEGSA